jgi:DNA-directed RNA polymerase specialized sigma24 family protein
MGLQLTRDEEDSFRVFYGLEHDRQVRRAALLLGSEVVAHDVVHDAMVEVLRRWSSLEQPGGYLHRAVLNGCRDAARRVEVTNRSLHRLAPVGSAAGEPDVLDDVLAELPFNHRAAVVLRYYLAMPTSEIAAVLGCAPGSVGVWIDRALKRMKEALT